jgi:hypothetical protein
VVAGIAAAAFAYVTNYCYASAAATYDLVSSRPYVRSTIESAKWNCRGTVAHWLAVIFALASVALFVRGVFVVVDAMTVIKSC